jgi:hypothetical protein
MAAFTTGSMCRQSFCGMLSEQCCRIPNVINGKGFFWIVRTALFLRTASATGRLRRRFCLGATCTWFCAASTASRLSRFFLDATCILFRAASGAGFICTTRHQKNRAGQERGDGESCKDSFQVIPVHFNLLRRPAILHLFIF